MVLHGWPASIAYSPCSRLFASVWDEGAARAGAGADSGLGSVSLASTLTGVESMGLRP